MGSSASKTSSSSTSAYNSPPETKLSSQLPSSSTIPKAFSFPMPLVHHPPVKKGDTHHLVSLTSSTYGSLLLADLDGATNSSDRQKFTHISIPGKDNKETPKPEKSHDSLSPDSVINTWELMNGLDDQSDVTSTAVNLDSFTKPFVNRDVCVNGSVLKLDESYEFVKIQEDWIPLSYRPKQPLWKHMSEESFLSDLDSNIISSYKRALSSKQLSKNSSNVHKSKKSLSCSQSLVPLSPLKSQTLEDQEKPRLSETEDNKKKKKMIVLYFTSLRGIRKTYEDCCYVRSILRGFKVAVEERDISMDFKYRKELQIAIGKDTLVCLPQVFIRGTHIGGIEEIKILNDGGELEEMLKEFPACESLGACESCGEARFVPCTNCCGSTKVFEEQEDGFKKCNECNENGLIRCNKCCI